MTSTMDSLGSDSALVVGYESNKEGRKCLFNDALNTFYLRLYGVTHVVKDHSDSERYAYKRTLAANRKE